MTSNVLTISEAAPLMGYSRAHVVRLCESGKLPARKTARVWLISVDDAKQYGRKRPIIQRRD